MSWIELAAVLLGVAYILLAARESLWCWAAAAVSTTLFLILLIDIKLYNEAALQVFYLIMAGYGWYEWKYKGKSAGNDRMPITTWKVPRHLVVIGAGAILALLNGFLVKRYTDAQLPYLDAFTTIFSMITTWMVARKVLENWLYWVVIDSTAVYMYVYKELYLTALLFIFYTIIVIFGFIEWLNIYRKQQALI